MVRGGAVITVKTDGVWSSSAAAETVSELFLDAADDTPAEPPIDLP